MTSFHFSLQSATAKLHAEHHILKVIHFSGRPDLIWPIVNGWARFGLPSKIEKKERYVGLTQFSWAPPPPTYI